MVFKVKGKVITPAEMQAKKEAKEKQKAKAIPLESTEITDVYKPTKAKKAKSTTKKKSSL
tara:strand:+ start:2299 stop:2478 length:180 start_codon:yes stop_codon:yes gene_type:complete